jgi:hypothetical protein
MKIKLNLKQIESLRRELEETDRKRFDISDVSEVFRMLQYWSKSIGRKEAKIKSITELGDGYLCRVNSTFRESMKGFLKDIRSREHEEKIREAEERGIPRTASKLERLIMEAEEKQARHDNLD